VAAPMKCVRSRGECVAVSSMPQRTFSLMQEDFEKVVHALRASSDSKERKALLIELKDLINEADQFFLEPRLATNARVQAERGFLDHSIGYPGCLLGPQPGLQDPSITVS
jgi:hypothetical protein